MGTAVVLGPKPVLALTDGVDSFGSSVRRSDRDELLALRELLLDPLDPLLLLAATTHAAYASAAANRTNMCGGERAPLDGGC